MREEGKKQFFVAIQCRTKEKSVVENREKFRWTEFSILQTPLNEHRTVLQQLGKRLPGMLCGFKSGPGDKYFPVIGDD